jgi:hypothetical protein
MIRTIFKITFTDDTTYYTADRIDVVNKINDFHKDDDTFKKYTIGTINGVLYNSQKNVRGVKNVERFNVRDFYKDYIDTYTEKINKNKNGKNYNEQSIKRLQNHFISFINMEILTAKNNGETDDNIKENIYKIAMLKV